MAIVVAGIDVLGAAAYLATRWTDPFFGWRFYIQPLLSSLIVFIVVVVASAFVLRHIHRRHEVLPSTEEA